MDSPSLHVVISQKNKESPCSILTFTKGLCPRWLSFLSFRAGESREICLHIAWMPDIIERFSPTHIEWLFTFPSPPSDLLTLHPFFSKLSFSPFFFPSLFSLCLVVYEYTRQTRACVVIRTYNEELFWAFCAFLFILIGYHELQLSYYLKAKVESRKLTMKQWLAV